MKKTLELSSFGLMAIIIINSVIVVIIIMSYAQQLPTPMTVTGVGFAPHRHLSVCLFV